MNDASWPPVRKLASGAMRAQVQPLGRGAGCDRPPKVTSRQRPLVCVQVGMDDQTSRFRKHAHESRELAKRAQTEHERALHEEMATHWEALAQLWPQVSRFGRERS
jgi:hypothetical protein